MLFYPRFKYQLSSSARRIYGLVAQSTHTILLSCEFLYPQFHYPMLPGVKKGFIQKFLKLFILTIHTYTIYVIVINNRAKIRSCGVIFPHISHFWLLKSFRTSLIANSFWRFIKFILLVSNLIESNSNLPRAGHAQFVASIDQLYRYRWFGNSDLFIEFKFSLYWHTRTYLVSSVEESP